MPRDCAQVEAALNKARDGGSGEHSPRNTLPLWRDPETGALHRGHAHA